MIIGNGLLASALLRFDNPSVIFFASGVSNSSEDRQSVFLREKELLTKYVNNGKNIVYFSTCSIYDPLLCSSPYVLHKLNMESIVSLADRFLYLGYHR